MKEILDEVLDNPGVRKELMTDDLQTLWSNLLSTMDDNAIKPLYLYHGSKNFEILFDNSSRIIGRKKD